MTDAINMANSFDEKSQQTEETKAREKYEAANALHARVKDEIMLPLTEACNQSDNGVIENENGEFENPAQLSFSHFGAGEFDVEQKKDPSFFIDINDKNTGNPHRHYNNLMHLKCDVSLDDEGKPAVSVTSTPTFSKDPNKHMDNPEEPPKHIGTFSEEGFVSFFKEQCLEFIRPTQRAEIEANLNAVDKDKDNAPSTEPG